MNCHLNDTVRAELLLRFSRLFAAYRRADKSHQILRRTFFDLAVNPIRAMAAFEEVKVDEFDPLAISTPRRLVVTDYLTGETLARSMPRKYEVLEVTEGGAP